ncbi:MAG TPA: PAS domain-containing protein [Methanoregulaceae archaeon]|nr:PAS domain-containing protein [Methanoregulaceae archaeon]
MFTTKTRLPYHSVAFLSLDGAGRLFPGPGFDRFLSCPDPDSLIERPFIDLVGPGDRPTSGSKSGIDPILELERRASFRIATPDGPQRRVLLQLVYPPLLAEVPCLMATLSAIAPETGKRSPDGCPQAVLALLTTTSPTASPTAFRAKVQTLLKATGDAHDLAALTFVLVRRKASQTLPLYCWPDEPEHFGDMTRALTADHLHAFYDKIIEEAHRMGDCVRRVPQPLPGLPGAWTISVGGYGDTLGLFIGRPSGNDAAPRGSELWLIGQAILTAIERNRQAMSLSATAAGMDMVSDPMLIVDNQGRILAANSGCRAFLDSPREALCLQRFDQLIALVDSAGPGLPLSETDEQDEHTTILDGVYTGAEGRRIPVRCQFRRIPDDRINLSLVMLEEIREANAPEHLLAQYRITRQKRLASAHVQVWEGPVGSGDPRMALQAAFDTGFASLGSTVCPGDRELVEDTVDRILAQSGETREFALIVRLADHDGRIRWVQGRGVVGTDEAGSPVRILDIALDITDHRLAEESLIRVYQKMGLMTSIVRHDILNQLTILRGYLMIVRDMSAVPEMQEALGTVDAAAEKIQCQILFTREYQMIGSSSPCWQVLPAVVRKADASLKPHRLAVAVEVDEIECYADPLLERIFYNMVENTLRHAPDAPLRSGSAPASRQGRSKSCTRTTAPGMPGASKETIFLQGYGQNTGLGLFLVREILSITGISLAEEGAEGKGARFVIRVPHGSHRRVEADPH